VCYWFQAEQRIGAGRAVTVERETEIPVPVAKSPQRHPRVARLALQIPLFQKSLLFMSKAAFAKKELPVDFRFRLILDAVSLFSPNILGWRQARRYLRGCSQTTPAESHGV
jgi:hypothetical protein